MSRITAPARTHGDSPSHSPPDMVFAPGIGVARALGWFSIGLGLAELIKPRDVSTLTGVRLPHLLQTYGLRAIICGIGILSSTRPVGWMWARVAGDVIDLATIGAVIGENTGEDAQRSLATLVAVGGVTALDVTVAMQLSAAAALTDH